MNKDKPGIEQREKENLVNHQNTKPDYSDQSEELQEAIGDSS